MSEYNERFIGLGSLSTSYPFHSLCWLLFPFLSLFLLIFDCDSNMAKEMKCKDACRLVMLCYCLIQMVHFLLFTTNLPIAHTTILVHSLHTTFTISFWITIYHSPLAIASFVSKTFILHFIKLEIIFPYIHSARYRFPHWAFFSFLFVEIQFDLFSRHKSEELNMQNKIKKKNKTTKRESSSCSAKRKVHNCLFAQRISIHRHEISKISGFFCDNSWIFVDSK